MATIRLHSRVQQVLFICELQGQISDGFWENARPYDHYRVISSAKVVVDSKDPGLDFYPDRRYNFASSKLLEYVGDRMLMFARAALYLPNASPQAIQVIDYGNWIFEDKYLPTYRSLLAELGVKSPSDIADLKEKISEVDYTLKDLRRDLREISKVVNRN